MMKNIVDGILTFFATGIWLIVAAHIIYATVKKVCFKLEESYLEGKEALKLIGLASIIGIALILIARIIIFSIFKALMF